VVCVLIISCETARFANFVVYHFWLSDVSCYPVLSLKPDFHSVQCAQCKSRNHVYFCILFASNTRLLCAFLMQVMTQMMQEKHAGKYTMNARNFETVAKNANAKKRG